MEEFIFYTTEGFTYDPEGNDVENCQLLGIAYGEDKADALDNLLKKNPFILEHGFDPCRFISRKLAN
ncbi:MAG: hypothetical protein KBT41_00200 [bacterium]|nr:hypothetical protein [Candidatus Colousia faecequi]